MIFTKKDLIELVQDLKDYTAESRVILGHDEREAEEFVDIFLKKKYEQEKYSQEDVAELMYNFFKITPAGTLQRWEQRHYLDFLKQLRGRQFNEHAGKF